MSDETGEYIDLQSWIWELDSLSFADILFSELCDDGLATVQLRIMTHLVQRRKPFVFFWNSVACSSADLRSSAPHSLNFPIVQKLIHEINCRSCADLCLSGICPLERDRVTSQTDLSANCFHSLSEMEFSGNLHLQKNIVLSWKTGFSRFTSILFCRMQNLCWMMMCSLMELQWRKATWLCIQHMQWVAWNISGALTLVNLSLPDGSKMVLSN